MDVTYRPARPDDLEPGLRVVEQAYNELRGRNGLRPVALREPTFQRFAHTEDPSGLWVAEAEGTIIGFAFSWMRQRFWYLAQLFIRPDIQARGIGQALMSRTLEQAAHYGAENRALITTGYNMASTGLYIRNGLYPREPLYRLVAPAVALAGELVADSGMEATPLGAFPGHYAWLDTVEEAVIGFRRETQHRFMQSIPGMRALRIDAGGRPAGYAYVSAEGHIGPLLAAPEADEATVVLSAIRAGLVEAPKQVSLVVPGRAERILAALSQLGFRIEESMLMMAVRSFGDWTRYLPSSPGIM
jgi:GNAT superfamily N-acetyltransferase